MHPDLHATHLREAASLTAAATITVLVGVVVTIAGWGTQHTPFPLGARARTLDDSVGGLCPAVLPLTVGLAAPVLGRWKHLLLSMMTKESV